MASHFYRLLIGTLVVWRLTHLLYGEDGPWNLLARLRYFAGQGFWGDLMDCFLLPEPVDRAPIRHPAGRELERTFAVLAGIFRGCNPAGAPRHLKERREAGTHHF